MKVAILQPPYLAAAETIAWETEQLCLLEDSGCDLVVLPEYSNVTGIEEAAALREFAAGEGGAFIGRLAEFARNSGCAVAAGVVVADGAGRLRNRLILIGSDGQTVGGIDKMHLTDAETELGLVPGEKIELLEFNGLKIAAAICFDQYFPEYFTALARRGADLILCPSYQRAESAGRIRLLAAARALDSGAWLIRSSYSVENSPERAGNSLLVSPSGELAAVAGGMPAVLITEFNPARKFRKPASFGRPEVEHRQLIEAHRRWAFYRPENVLEEGARLCAHRGLSAAMPENTLPAFAAAIAVGAHEIEFDLFLSADLVPVVSHDPDLARVAGVPHRVEELTWEEIRRIDLGAVYGERWKGIQIPRLEEVLDISGGRVGLNIHLKTPGPDGVLLRMVGRELSRRNLLGRAYVGGEADVLEAAIRHVPEVPRSCMAEQHDSARLVDNAIRYGCRYLQFYASFQPEDVVRAHRAGIRCNLFFADDYPAAAEAVAHGIDTVLTNRAAELLAAPGSLFRPSDSAFL